MTDSNPKEVLYSGAAGRIAPDEDSRPWDIDTFVWLASMTKLITSTCIMQIVEAGKIGLDDDVRPLVPELAGMQILQGFDGDTPILKDNSAAITLRYPPSPPHHLATRQMCAP